MSFIDPIDTTAYDFDQWIQFAFDHDVSDPPWYSTEEMYFLCTPSIVIGYYTRLFLDPRPSLSRYDDARLEQGVWFVVGAQLSEWLWSDEVPLELRLECIAAMPAMFRKFLIDHPLDTACFMWWDTLRDFSGAPDPAIIDAIARALEEVLQVDARHCQMSALHGLAHLPRALTEGIVRRFLASHPDADDEVVQYANAAMAGNVL